MRTTRRAARCVERRDLPWLGRIGDVEHEGAAARLTGFIGVLGHDHRAARYSEAVAADVGCDRRHLREDARARRVGDINRRQAGRRRGVSVEEDAAAVRILLEVEPFSPVALAVQIGMTDQTQVLRVDGPDPRRARG
jgi:hypothetical protein